jgi:Glyoxalase/Bleomycin resistance protein/Dioxygenase superfamily
VTAPILQRLEFIYMPSADPAAEIEHFEQALGARIVFAIERFGTRVAMVELGSGNPTLLFAAHLEGERPILVYRVEDLNAATGQLRERGCEISEEFGIPPGEIRAIETPGGHRLAIYEETRPDRIGSIAGRRDF